MQDHPLLGHVVLGYAPVVDRQRAVAATRLTVFPERPDASVDGAQLQALLAWPWQQLEGASKGLALPTGPARTFINVAGEGLLRALLAAAPAPQTAIEVPTFMAADASLAPLLAAHQSAGGTLVLKGAAREALPAAVAGCFAACIDDGGAAPAVAGLPRLRDGVTAPRELDAALAAGAAAALGWPFGDAPVAVPAKSGVAPELQVIMELINRVEREEPVDRLEAVLKNDPTLAFRLLRYINSPGFGLSVEISSFRHALMILGYQRLKRWLALLLASAGKSPNLKPVMHAAVRRGLLMEELVKGSGDSEMRGEIFICGVFSLLDRLLEQPFAALLRSVPVPQRVQQALLEDAGPFAPYVHLVQAIEQASVIDIREGADALMVGMAEVNRALLSALAGAAQLE